MEDLSEILMEQQVHSRIEEERRGREKGLKVKVEPLEIKETFSSTPISKVTTPLSFKLEENEEEEEDIEEEEQRNNTENHELNGKICRKEISWKT